MPTSDAARDYLLLYPNLHMLNEQGYMIWNTLWNYRYIRRDTPSFDEAIERLGIFIPPFAHALNDPRVSQLEQDFYDAAVDGLETVHAAASMEELVVADDDFAFVIDGVQRFMLEAGRIAIGEWGEYFLRAYTDDVIRAQGGGCGNQWPIGRSRRQWRDGFRVVLPFALNDKNGKPLEDLPAPHALVMAMEPPFEIDDESFSVTADGREPCLLGNTHQFRLLKLLASNRGRWVTHEAISCELCGDEVGATAVPAAKRRLVRDLETGGFAFVARGIESQKGHYRLAQSAQ